MIILSTWLCANNLTLNVLKTEFVLIGSRQKLTELEEDVTLVSSHVVYHYKDFEVKKYGLT